MEKEIRSIELNSISTENNSRKVGGYAIVFNSLSNDLGGFKEIVEQGAADDIIELSDVFARFNHENNKILARSKFGKGSLKLSIDDKGLFYEFESPRTYTGDELLEALNRGDIDSSSFAFTVKSDEWTLENGVRIRRIKKFEKIYDVAPVYSPAYDATTVQCQRFLEILEEEKEEVKVDETIVEVKDEQENDEPIVEVKDEQENDEPIVEENKEEETVEEKIDERNQNELIINNKNNEKKMEKFNILSAINEVVNHRNLSEQNAEAMKEIRSEMKKSNLAFSGDIQVPLRAINVTSTHGIENVGTEVDGIAEPLRNEMSLVAAGAKFLSGLIGDVKVPTYAGSSVTWEGETATAKDGAGAFASITLKPKRLTAIVDVSKQFLLQDTNDAENMLKNDIVKAIAEKLEGTILGAESGSTTQPAGLFYGVTGTTATSYTGVTSMEATLEGKKVKNYKFIVNPTAKFAFKATQKGNGVGFVYENNEIDGVEAISTGNVTSKGIVVADWNDLIIGSWGGLDITVDAISKAADGVVRLVVNFYCDAAFRRDSYVASKIA